MATTLQLDVSYCLSLYGVPKLIHQARTNFRHLFDLGDQAPQRTAYDCVDSRWNWWMLEESLRPSTPSIIHMFGSLTGRSVGKMPACLMLKLTQILLGYSGIQPCGLVHPNYNWLSPTHLKNDGVKVSCDHYSQPMESHKIPWFQTTNQLN